MYYLYLYNTFYIVSLLIIFFNNLVLKLLKQHFYLYINLNKTYTTNVIWEYFIIYWNTLFFNYGFVFFLVFINIVLFSYILNQKNFINLFFILLYLYIYNIYICYNSDLNFFNYTINNLLINKINYIHPLLIYIFSSYVLCNYILINNSKNYIIFIKYYYKILITLLCIIFLGCWWSYQEDMWNSWWFWEISEILNLIYIFLILILLHTNIIYKNKIYLLNTKMQIMWLLLFNYSLVQIYLSDTNHNFINYYSLTIIFISSLLYYLIKFCRVLIFLKFNLNNANFCNLLIMFCKIFFLVYILYYIYIYNYWHLLNQINILIFDMSIFNYVIIYYYILILNFNYFKISVFLYKHILIILILFYLCNIIWNSFIIFNYKINYFDFNLDNLFLLYIINEWNYIYQYKWIFNNYLVLSNITSLNNICLLFSFSLYYFLKYNFYIFKILL